LVSGRSTGLVCIVGVMVSFLSTLLSEADRIYFQDSAGDGGSRATGGHRIDDWPACLPFGQAVLLKQSTREPFLRHGRGNGCLCGYSPSSCSSTMTGGLSPPSWAMFSP
jgi:hypothetical protein